MNKAINQGPTGYFSSEGFKVLGTFPRAVTFFVCFSLATRILCLDGIVDVLLLT